jgi:mono/diheme cytochrome c family protein
MGSPIGRPCGACRFPSCLYNDRGSKISGRGRVTTDAPVAPEAGSDTTPPHPAGISKTPMRKTLRQWLAAAAITAGIAASAAWAQNEPDLARGEAVFTYWCATCHSAGPGMPGTQALRAKYDGNLPAVLTERTDLTPELISFYVRNGISVMPFFRKTEVSDSDLEAVAAYIVATAHADR